MPNAQLIGLGGACLIGFFFFVLLSGTIFSAIPDNASYVGLFVVIIPFAFLFGGGILLKMGMGS